MADGAWARTELLAQITWRSMNKEPLPRELINPFFRQRVDKEQQRQAYLEQLDGIFGGKPVWYSDPE